MPITNSFGVTEDDILRIFAALDASPDTQVGGRPPNLAATNLAQFRANPEGYEVPGLAALSSALGLSPFTPLPGIGGSPAPPRAPVSGTAPSGQQGSAPAPSAPSGGGPSTQGNPFLGFLEEEPKTAYFSYGNQFGGAPRSQRREKFFQNQFTDIYNQYLGRLGSQVRAGQAPEQKWNDYLGGFDFNKWYQEQVPFEERNPQQGRFVPETKWRVGPRYQGNNQQGVFGG